MKKFIFIFSLFLLPAINFAQVGEWTWMNGNNTLTNPGVFGTQGVFAAGNTPPGLYEACEWTDPQGNFWLFGGVQNGEFNTLWKYDVSLNQWAWIKGSNSVNGAASYGTMGVPSPTNNPGHRGWGVMTWTGLNGKLWLFGGYGADVNGFSGGLNDLWKYDPTTNEWTWMHGANTANQVGNYGTMGVPAITNDPPDRQENNASWIDSQGNLWLYGGLSSSGTTGNDLWMFNTSTNMWTWMWGSQNINNPNYGTKGVEAASNDPGSRFCYTKFVDSFDNLYFFGASTGSFGGNLVSDVWRYRISSGMWTWIGGTNTLNEPGNYSGFCDTNALDVPRSKIEIRASWPDSCGFWLYGGFDSDAANDLWYYNLYNNKFTWVTGSSVTGAAPSYGTILVSSSTNDPGGRGGTLSWKDNSGNLWLFGGYATGFAGQLNDLWRFVPDTSCVQLCKFTNPTANPPPPVIPEELSIPNVFSPNGDSINDLFEITAIGFKDYKLHIYNRWGAQVFESNDHLKHWNGKIEGSKDEASDGTYYYVLKLVNNADKEISYNGFLTLLRNK